MMKQRCTGRRHLMLITTTPRALQRTSWMEYTYQQEQYKPPCPVTGNDSVCQGNSLLIDIHRAWSFRTDNTPLDPILSQFNPIHIVASINCEFFFCERITSYWTCSSKLWSQRNETLNLSHKVLKIICFKNTNNTGACMSGIIVFEHINFML